MRVQITEQDLKNIYSGNIDQELSDKISSICKIGIAATMKTGLGKGDSWKDYSGEAYLYLRKQVERLLPKIADYTDEARGSSLVMAVMHGVMDFTMNRSDEAVSRKLHKNGISHWCECNDFVDGDDFIEETGKSVWDSMYEAIALPRDRQRKATLLEKKSKSSHNEEPLF